MDWPVPRITQMIRSSEGWLEEPRVNCDQHSTVTPSEMGGIVATWYFRQKPCWLSVVPETRPDCCQVVPDGSPANVLLFAPNACVPAAPDPNLDSVTVSGPAPEGARFAACVFPAASVHGQ